MFDPGTTSECKAWSTVSVAELTVVEHLKPGAHGMIFDGLQCDAAVARRCTVQNQDIHTFVLRITVCISAPGYQRLFFLIYSIVL